MVLRTRRTIPALAAWLPACRQAGAILGFALTSLIMALLVAVAAAAMEGPSDAARPGGASVTSGLDIGAWCTILNGRMICVGEPD